MYIDPLARKTIHLISKQLNLLLCIIKFFEECKLVYNIPLPLHNF